MRKSIWKITLAALLWPMQSWALEIISPPRETPAATPVETSAPSETAVSTPAAITMPEVLVTAPAESLVSPSFESAVKDMGLTPGGAGVVDARTLNNGRLFSLQDAFSGSAGVYAQQGVDGSRFSIRGSGIAQFSNLRGILLMQDGVPINRADGRGDFKDIDFLSFKYLQVFRGANALQFGANTLGGAVNLVSHTGRDAVSSQARLEKGSWGYLNGQISTSGMMQDFDYYLSLSNWVSDGFRAYYHESKQQFSGNLGFPLAPGMETRLFAALSSDESQPPGYLTRQQMQTDPTQANPINLAGKFRYDSQVLRASNQTALEWEGQRMEETLFYTNKHLYHRLFSLLDQFSNDYGLRLRYRNSNTFLGVENLFTAGANGIWGSAQDDRYQNAGGNQGALLMQGVNESTNLELFAEEQYAVIPSLFLVAGAQFTHSIRQYRDQFLADGDQSGVQTYENLNPKFGVRYALDSRSVVFANWSVSFEPPSFFELLPTANATATFEQLKAQAAGTFEVGSRGRNGWLEWDLALYHTDITNELLGYNVGLAGTSKTVNATPTTHEGIEAGLCLYLLEGFLAPGLVKDRISLRQVYNLNHFNFKSDPDWGRNRLPGIPLHFYRAELKYEHPSGVYMGPNMEWVPMGYPVDMANRVFTDPYTIWGFKAGWRREKGMSLFLEGKNLGNTVYMVSTSVITTQSGGMSLYNFLPGDGLAVYGGAEWKW